MSTVTVNIPSPVLNYANLAAFPVSGALKTIYIAEDTKLQYYWDGSAYQLLSASSGGRVQSVTGDGVDNTDPLNPVLTFPTPSDIGLGNVNNTSDANKPISSATQTALNAKQDSLGYTAENSANKTDVMSGNTTSSTKYLSAKGVYDWAVATFQSIGTYLTSANITQTITNGVTDKAPSEDAVFDALALKAALTDLPYDISRYRKTGTGTFKQYYTQGITQNALVTVAIGGNTARYMPLIVSKTTTLAEIGVEVTSAGSAGSVARLAIYSSSNQLPDQLILNAGTIASNSATAQLITGLSTVLTPGLYFLYFNTNSTTSVSLRCLPVSAIPNICGATSAMGANSISYLFVLQTYTASPPTTALSPSSQTTVAPIAFFMYFSS